MNWNQKAQINRESTIIDGQSRSPPVGTSSFPYFLLDPGGNQFSLQVPSI